MAWLSVGKLYKLLLFYLLTGFGLRHSMELKNRILSIFQYLWEHTDETHTTTLEKLKNYLQSCGLSRPDSRIIKADIDQLIEFGVDIVVNRRV
ncbi:hypothetical protein D7X33_11755 [Butyricicoccus sp. 1XD8-22]|nr:hypothetical protein D7X33_11755 [Butyricicoccus sp. 1XD8-22]